MNCVRRIVVAAGLAVSAIGSASANLVSNGSFETFTGTFGSDGGAELLSGSTSVTGWTVAGGEIAVLKNGNIYNLTASDGTQFLDLTGYSNTGFPKGVSQTISGLTAGQGYVFSMDLGVRNGPCVSGGDNCTGPIQVSASIGGTSQTFTENSPTAGNVWGTFGFDFTASSSSQLLTIEGLSVPAGGAYIGLDNVTLNPGVSAVPLPAAAWLLGSGLVSLWGFARRARRG